jgi:hypothetical protein
MVFLFKMGTTSAWFITGGLLERLTFFAVLPIVCHVDASTKHFSLGQLMSAMAFGTLARCWVTLATTVQTLDMLPLQAPLSWSPWLPYGTFTCCATCMLIHFVLTLERRGALAYGRKPSQNFLCTPERCQSRHPRGALQKAVATAKGPTALQGPRRLKEFAPSIKVCGLFWPPRITWMPRRCQEGIALRSPSRTPAVALCHCEGP